MTTLPERAPCESAAAGKPLYKVFSTDAGSYLYDTATNQILTLPEDFARYLEGRTFSAGELDELAADHRGGVLVPTSALPMSGQPDRSAVREALGSRCKQLILEATRDCNMRCKYCLYSRHQPGKRGTCKQDMPLATARKAVEYFHAHSSGQAKAALGFYGGEPLLNASLVRKATEYARKVIRGKELTCSLTTNGTLLDPEIMAFLADNEFFTFISLDGPRDMNDRNRIFAGSGKGTFDVVTAGLGEFQRRHPEYCRRCVGFSIVIAPGTDLVRLAEWVRQWDLALALVTYASDDTGELERAYQDNPVTGSDRLRAEYVEAASGGRLAELRGRLTFCIHSGLFNVSLSALRKRPVPTSPGDRRILRGICTPGQQRLFVDCDGDLYPCEKTEGYRHLRLGHVDSGVDVDKAYDIMVKFHDFLVRECSSCWMWRLCPVCLVGPTVGHGYDRAKARRACENQRREMTGILKMYCAILETNRTALDCLLENGSGTP